MGSDEGMKGERETLRRSTMTGAPLGPREFVRQLEKRKDDDCGFGSAAGRQRQKALAGFRACVRPFLRYWKINASVPKFSELERGIVGRNKDAL